MEPEDCRTAAPAPCVQSVAHTFDGKGLELTSELRLRNLTSREIGAYQCIVENQYGATYSGQADIRVYVYPQFQLTPVDRTVAGGASVTLQCSATGLPPPDISWQKDSGSDFPAARERRLRVDPALHTYTIQVNCTPSHLYIVTPVPLLAAGEGGGHGCVHLHRHQPGRRHHHQHLPLRPRQAEVRQADG